MLGSLPRWLQAPGEEIARFEAALGIPVGPLMHAFIALFLREGLAFDAHLDCVVDPELPRVRHLTPENVHPFVATRGGEQFALLATSDRSRSTDERPICRVARESPTTRVIAPDLAGFLSLLAIAGTYEIGRDTPDRGYWEVRQELLADSDHGADFLRISERLCALPGVSLPPRPSAIAQAHPDLAFEVREDETLSVTLPYVRALWAEGRHEDATMALRMLVDKWLELGDLVHRSNWSALKTTLAELRPALPADLRARLGTRGV